MVYTVGTLFSGIGVPDLACALLGMDVLFQVEIDEFCQKVLAKHEKTHWPNVRRFTDVRSVGAGTLPVVDILIGGFPCQDLSFAGRRRGMGEGTRSGLWSEFARIIAELQPRCIVIENVPGVLAPIKARRRCFTREPATRFIRQAFRTCVIAPPPAFQVITQLRQMGYVVSSGVISAEDFGAQHKRERWWCVAYKRPTMGYAHSSNIVGAVVERFTPSQFEQGLSEGAGFAVGHPYSIGIQGQWPAWEQVLGARYEPRTPAVASLATAGNGHAAQSGVGGNADGLTRGLDFVRSVSAPNQAQYDYEPPRVVQAGLPNRAHRIKALGNAWDFRNAYGLMAWVKDFLDNQTPHKLGGH